MHLTVLSPHRDDAVFSLAVTLQHLAREHEVTVLNFFTESVYGPRAITAEPTHANISYLRRREDRRALAVVSARIAIRDCGLLDAPVRLKVPTRRVLGPDALKVRPQDIVQAVAMLQTVRTSAVIAPLALGNHVDHRTVRDAAMRSFPANMLAFYEDLPYVMWASEGEIRRQLEATGAALTPRRIRRETWTKRRAARLYATQIAPKEAWDIARYSATRGGERIWIPQHSQAWNTLL